MHCFYRFFSLFLILLTHILYSQNTGLSVNPAIVEGTNVKYVDWQTETVQEFSIDASAFRVAGVGVNEANQAQFFVIQLDGVNEEASLYIYNTEGVILSSEPMEGLLHEMQVLQVPETTNEWYIIYGGEPGEIVFQSSASYTPNKLRYSRVFYDGISFNFLEKVVLTVNGTTHTYSDGRAVSFNLEDNEQSCSFFLYAGRRSSGESTFSMDRFLIDNSGINWQSNTGEITLPYWGWGISGSPIEVSHQGDKIAYCNRNVDNNAADILIFDAIDFSTASLQIITLDDLILQPDFIFLDAPTSIEALVGSADFPFFNQFSYKFRTIEFSPSGDYLYIGGGGNQISGSAFRSYLGQIDLTSSYPYDLRLQIQETSFNYIINIESFYGDKLYFTKTQSNVLFAIPNADQPMPQNLSPNDIDIATSNFPNFEGITITENFNLLDGIDGYNYMESCLNIFTGCTDLTACNYDPNATEDDGSCLYLDCIGECGGINIAGTPCDDGNENTTEDTWTEQCECIGIVISLTGCTDPIACNYDPNATEDDGSCLYLDCLGECGGINIAGTPCDDGNENTTEDTWTEQCECLGIDIGTPGCTDSLALNYDLMATEDDGSCMYCEANAGTLITDGLSDFYCGEAIVNISINATDFQSSYTQAYILTNEVLDILTINTSGGFDNLSSGSYIIHAINILPEQTPTDLSALIGLNAIDILANLNCYDLISSDSFVVLKPIEIASNYDCNVETGIYTLTFSISGGMPEYATTIGTGEAADFFYTASGDLSGNYTFGENTTIEYSDNTPYNINAEDSKSCSSSINGLPSPCIKTALELLSFNGWTLERINELRWETASETDNAYFIIERSTDGMTFEKIGEMKGAINSQTTQSYTYQDKEVSSGVYYYRLQAVDISGETEIVSKVIRLEQINKDFFIQKITPNPADDFINLSFISDINTIIELNIYDIKGRILHSQKLEPIVGANNMKLNIASYPKGIYFLQLKNPEYQNQVKFVK